MSGNATRWYGWILRGARFAFGNLSLLRMTLNLSGRSMLRLYDYNSTEQIKPPIVAPHPVPLGVLEIVVTLQLKA